MRAREATAIAENIVSSFPAKTGRVAIYLALGEVKTTRVGSVVFDRLEANGMQAVIGIYGSRCNPEWIKEDLLSASVLMTEKKTHRVIER